MKRTPFFERLRYRLNNRPTASESRYVSGIPAFRGYGVRPGNRKIGYLWKSEGIRIPGPPLFLSLSSVVHVISIPERSIEVGMRCGSSGTNCVSWYEIIELSVRYNSRLPIHDLARCIYRYL